MNTSNPVKAVVFDLDDTLIEYMLIKRQCVSDAVDAMVQAGLTTPKVKAVERIYQMYNTEGFEDQKIFDKYLIQELGSVNFKILAAAVIAYKKAKARITPYPGVPETLVELLKQDIRIAVLTDAPSLSAWTRLTEAKLHHFFDPDLVLGFESSGKRKPHPTPFKMVLQKLGVTPEQTLFVGDWMERDMCGARAAGMITAYVLYNSTNSGIKVSQEDSEDLVDYKLGAFKDILSIVKNHGVAAKVPV